jgi:hypothetical protein
MLELRFVCTHTSILATYNRRSDKTPNMSGQAKLFNGQHSMELSQSFMWGHQEDWVSSSLWGKARFKRNVYSFKGQKRTGVTQTIFIFLNCLICNCWRDNQDIDCIAI